jgi:hypothetical protein
VLKLNSRKKETEERTEKIFMVPVIAAVTIVAVLVSVAQAQKRQASHLRVFGERRIPSRADRWHLNAGGLGRHGAGRARIVL